MSELRKTKFKTDMVAKICIQKRICDCEKVIQLQKIYILE